jgi:CubicO group peptidase (beta-lactamase class C family)
MKHWTRVLGVGLVVAVGAQAQGSATADPRAAQMARSLLPALATERTRAVTLQERMRHYGVPGLSVAVVDDGRIAWAAAWGYADAAARVPMIPATRLQSGSIAKPVAALGALKLVELGRLTLDEPVGPRLPSWPYAAELPPGVNLRRLLSHDAGLTVGGFAGYLPDGPMPTLLQLLDGLPPANSPAVRSDRAPGLGWRYSGGGYQVMQLLMQEITQERFADWMQREVLLPAGMTASLYGVLPQATAADVAVGHQGLTPMPERRRTYPEQAAAGLLTTPSDLARLTLQLQAALAGSERELLRPATLRQVLQPQARGSGMVMGLGFFLFGAEGNNRFGHDGSNQGFESVWRLDGRRALIVMANSNGASELRRCRAGPTCSSPVCAGATWPRVTPASRCCCVAR